MQQWVSELHRSLVARRRDASAKSAQTITKSHWFWLFHFILEGVYTHTKKKKSKPILRRLHNERGLKEVQPTSDLSLPFASPNNAAISM